MTSANIWNPQPNMFLTQANAEGTFKQEIVLPTPGEYQLRLESFAYAPNTGSILVFKNKQLLHKNIDYVETDETTITVVDITVSDDEYAVLGFVGITGTVVVDEILRAELRSPTGAGLIGLNYSLNYPDDSLGATALKGKVPRVGNQGFDYRRIDIADTNFDGTDGAVGKVDGLNITHTFGGVNAKGGRHGLEVLCALTSTTAATNPDRNYVGIAGTGMANATDGGAEGASKGAVFGGNFVACLNAGATNYHNVSGMEVNTAIRAGSSVAIKTGIQICGFADDAVKGSTLDAMISLSGQTGGVKWDDGICFHPYNGDAPLGLNGALLSTKGAATIRAGIDLRSYTFTETAFAANGFEINPFGSLEIGLQGTANSPAINLHSSATATAFDARIFVVGGTAAAGKGVMYLEADWFDVRTQGIRLNGNNVVGPRITGWGEAFNGSKNSYNALTATPEQTNAALAQLIAAVTAHGLIGP
jgi:hypothetical protein